MKWRRGMKVPFSTNLGRKTKAYIGLIVLLFFYFSSSGSVLCCIRRD